MQFKYKKTNIYWEKKSSVRNVVRRVIDSQNDLYYYPINRQPLCIHPLVQQKGIVAVKFILAQSLYKFLYDIAIIEVALVNKVADKVFHNEYEVKFSEDLRNDMLTVIIDEAYHAYVALDFIEQTKNISKIVPVIIPTETQLTQAVKQIKSNLDQDTAKIFELIAVCIAENSITKELVSLSNEKELNQAFYHILSDHMFDEGRHNGIFTHVLEFFWFYLEAPTKEIIKKTIPVFIELYLDNDMQKAYDKEVLYHLNFTEESINTIIGDTYLKQDLRVLLKNNSAAKNIIKLLQRCGVMSEDEIKHFYNVNKNPWV